MMSDQIKPTWVIFTLVPSPGCSAHSLIIQKKKSFASWAFLFNLVSLLFVSAASGACLGKTSCATNSPSSNHLIQYPSAHNTTQAHTVHNCWPSATRTQEKFCYSAKRKKSSTYGFIFVSFSSHVCNVFDQNVFCKMCFTSKERNVKKAKQRSMCSLTQIEEVVFF